MISIKKITYKKITALSAISALAFLIVLSIHGTSFAKVTGTCANCHTMHNSQNGSAVAQDFDGSSYSTTTTPKSNLLIYSCLGCHSATDATTWKDTVTGAPIVFNTVEPSFNTVKGLAGGNFYWVKAGLGGDDTKGHNVFLGEPDGNLNEAPGSGVGPGCGGPGPGSTGCHSNLDSATTEGSLTFDAPRQGCTKCHMIGNSTAPIGYHHADDTGPLIDSPAEGWYRFLDGHQSGTGHGVTGIEDDDWQFTNSSSDHNEYLGNSTAKTSAGSLSNNGDTMTGYCCGCHGNFHIQNNNDPAASPWIRHPSDAVIPNSGEYASAFGASGGTGTYDPQVPVARPILSSGSWPSSNVNLNTDMVMCLSCHRPHGSPYPDMLRWDYNEMLAGDNTKSGGCFSCHTQKND